RSFITNLTNGAKVKAGGPTIVKGIAFDGGTGIKDVSLSPDGGKTWQAAKLGKDLGKYSFREWQLSVRLPPGAHDLKVRATNQAGQTQPETATWNPPGYMRNVIETTSVTAA
ncbi:Ig-like domain-containing protein, partial [Bradyrhizobium elkanii]|uniref:Ig-like domain-containing protein n=1 Tax=Bradyrhizobium elkanii TaxID=29448 RepID=UPI0004896567